MLNYGQNRGKRSQKLFFGKFGKIMSKNKICFFSLFFNAVGFSEDYCAISSGYNMINKKVMGKFLCCIKFGQKYRNGCLWKIASIYSKYFPKSITFKFYRRK